MKSRPIIMQAESVRAILDGRKTQTRRLLKLPRTGDLAAGDLSRAFADAALWGAKGWGGLHVPTIEDRVERLRSPHGGPGDLLWVKEVWASTGVEGDRCAYRADDGNASSLVWRSSLFMPRWASRLTLVIAEVRAERLQDITEADAEAEGLKSDVTVGERFLGRPAPERRPKAWRSAREKYARAWDEINGDRAPWASNPWVWVVTFERVVRGPE